MELRTLRYFVAAADAGSVNAAAPLLHVTQPAISRQLAQLQRELGITLFDTQGSRSTLTAAGKQFLPIARDLLVRAEKASQAAASFAAGKLESIAISAPTTTLSDVIAPFLATWGPDDPVPKVVESDVSNATSALMGGADLAIAAEEPGVQHSSVAIADLPIWAYVRSDHHWAGRRAVQVQDLVNEVIITMTPDFKPRKILDGVLAHAGLSPTNLLESSNAQVAQSLAAAGRGVAVVSDDPRFGLVPLRLHDDRGPINIRLFAAWDPEHHAHAKIAEVADRLKQFCQDRYGKAVRPSSRA